MFIKKTLRYVERDELKYSDYLKLLEKFAKKDLVYIDESGINHQEINTSCWTKKGTEVIGERQGSQRGRTSVAASLNGENINAPMTYSGTMNGELFTYWLKNFLVATLKKGQAVIMDNAAIHKVKKVRKIIEDAGCVLIYLPPYSPELNPIENYWAVMKNHLKKIRDKFDNIDQAIDHTLKNNKRYFGT